MRKYLGSFEFRGAVLYIRQKSLKLDPVSCSDYQSNITQNVSSLSKDILSSLPPVP